MSFRYLHPFDPWTLESLDLETLGPWDSWTSSLHQHLLILPLISSYLLLSLPPTLLLWYGLVRGRDEFVILENETGDGPLIFILNLKSCWVAEPWDLILPSTFSSSNLLPPPIYSSQLLLPPPKPPPDSSYLLPKDLR